MSPTRDCLFSENENKRMILFAQNRAGKSDERRMLPMQNSMFQIILFKSVIVLGGFAFIERIYLLLSKNIFSAFIILARTNSMK